VCLIVRRRSSACQRRSRWQNRRPRRRLSDGLHHAGPGAHIASSRPPLVPVVKSANFGEHHHATVRRRVDASWRGRVFLEGEVGSRAMIIGGVSSQHATQMCLVENDDVIEALAAQDPIRRSAYGLCQGLDGADTTSRMSMPATRRRNTSL